MNVDEAIQQACATVGILPPKGATRSNAWLYTDTLSGKNGRNDGRVIINDLHVTARNMQTDEIETVWLKDKPSPAERREMAQRREKDDAERRERADSAARVAERIVAAAKLDTHDYLANKGFPDEKALVVSAADVERIGGRYTKLPDGARAAIVIPARIGNAIRTVQLIWECGTKKFLFGGEMGGASHRIAAGRDLWFCEGYATGLSLRAGLKALNRSDTVLCCFSASNIETVARRTTGRRFICADHDKPLDQFGGRGTGEHYAAHAGLPYLMPPKIGMDLNDLHMAEGRFAVQRAISEFLRSASLGVAA